MPCGVPRSIRQRRTYSKKDKKREGDENDNELVFSNLRMKSTTSVFSDSDQSDTTSHGQCEFSGKATGGKANAAHVELRKKIAKLCADSNTDAGCFLPASSGKTLAKVKMKRSATKDTQRVIRSADQISKATRELQLFSDMFGTSRVLSTDKTPSENSSTKISLKTRPYRPYTRVASTRPVKSPRVGSKRYVGVLPCTQKPPALSQVYDNEDSEESNTSLDTYGGVGGVGSEVSTLDCIGPELLSTGSRAECSVKDGEKDCLTGDEYIYGITYATVTDASEDSSATDASIEKVRRQATDYQEHMGIVSPVQMITENDHIIQKGKGDADSPTIEYATYWTQPANRFRLSSTLLDEEAEYDLHRGLPAPDMSTIAESKAIKQEKTLLETIGVISCREIQKNQESTPPAKTSEQCPRLSKKRAKERTNVERTPEQNWDINRQRKNSFADSGFSFESAERNKGKGQTARWINFDGKASGSQESCAEGEQQLERIHHDLVTHIKMTSTPVLNVSELGSEMKNFSVEMSEIPRNDPKEELNVEVSFEVNSEEIVALTPSGSNDDTGEPSSASWGPRKTSDPVKVHVESQRLEERVIENNIVRKTPRKPRAANRIESQRASVKGAKTCKRKNGSGSSLEVVGRSQHKQTRDNSNVTSACRTKAGSVIKDETKNSGSISKLVNVSNRECGSKRMFHTSSSRRASVNTSKKRKGQTSLLQIKEPVGGRGIAVKAPFPNVPDDILTSDSIPTPKNEYPVQAVLVKWIRPSNPEIKNYEDYLSSIQSIPRDILQVSSDEDVKNWPGFQQRKSHLGNV